MVLRTFLTHVDGTSIDALKSDRIPSNNTTGVKGVYKIRGKYVAKIVFKKKQYILGQFDTLALAAEARIKLKKSSVKASSITTRSGSEPRRAIPCGQKRTR